MKRWIIAAMAFLTAGAASAQTNNVRFGLKGGANFSKFHITPEATQQSEKFGTGYFAGGLMEYSFPAGSKWKLQLEAMYSNHKPKVDYAAVQPVNVKYELSQVSVPVLAKYFVTPAFSINGGLSANFNTNLKSETTAGGAVTKLTDKDHLNEFQAGALVGATVYIHEGLFIDGRYNTYFGNTYKPANGASSPKMSLNNFQVGIGYKFKKG